MSFTAYVEQDWALSIIHIRVTYNGYNYYTSVTHESIWNNHDIEHIPSKVCALIKDFITPTNLTYCNSGVNMTFNGNMAGSPHSISLQRR